jgi:hypothetical protein
VQDWAAHVEREADRYRDGEARLDEATDADARQRQLTRMGNAAWGAGLAELMRGRSDDASAWFRTAAGRYRESWSTAPPGSWGRPIAAMKALLLAGDERGAVDVARRTVEAGAAAAESPIGRYAAALALLVLGDDGEARRVASTIRDRDDFPPPVADALATIAAGDRAGYLLAVEDVLESFETREEYLEDVPVADTVLVLQELARVRDLDVELPGSALLPGG